MKTKQTVYALTSVSLAALLQVASLTGASSSSVWAKSSDDALAPAGSSGGAEAVKPAKQAVQVGSQSEKPAAQTDKSSATKPELAPGLQAISTAYANYKWQPNAVSWSALVDALKAHFNESKSDWSNLQAQLPQLAELKTKVIDAGRVKIMQFPDLKAGGNRAILLAWNDAAAARAYSVRGTAGHKKAAKRIVAPVATAGAEHCQLLALPETVVLTDARVLDLPNGKDVSTGKPFSGRYLVVTGNQTPDGTIWVKSFKNFGSQWKESSDPLASVPPLLLQSLTGKAGFSGSDLVFSISSKVYNPNHVNTDKENKSSPAETGTYKFALQLVDGHYALVGRAVDDTPYNTVYQFLRAVQSGRTDLAKAWLADPKLAAIPVYVGLSSKTTNGNYRLINMTSPRAGGFRFRLITFEKDDLILDVAKTKTQWAIKAIFIAPADPLLQKIAGILPALELTAIKEGEPAPKPESFDLAPTNPVARAPGVHAAATHAPADGTALAERDPSISAKENRKTEKPASDAEQGNNSDAMFR